MSGTQTFLAILCVTSSCVLVEPTPPLSEAEVEPPSALSRSESRHDEVLVGGTDGRREAVFEPDPRVRMISQRSIFVFVCASDVDTTDPDNVLVSAQTLAVKLNVCTSERFSGQPVPGFCSGVLVDDDLVMTAAHCVSSLAGDPEPCSYRLIGDYEISSGNSIRTLTTDDVFSPMVRPDGGIWFEAGPTYLSTQQEVADHAIVRLDRTAIPKFQPAAVRRDSAKLSSDAGLSLMGHPSGLPLKIDDTGAVSDPGRRGNFQNSCTTDCDYYDGLVDAFHANSGSGVFLKPDYQVAGILTGGGTGSDYELASGQSCYLARFCSSACGIRIQYAYKAYDELCSNLPSSRVCRSEGDLHYFDWIASLNALLFY